MRAAKVQASLRIRAVSPEPSLLVHTSSESRGTFRQKARSLAPLNGWACAFKVCHDGILEDTNSLGGAHLNYEFQQSHPDGKTSTKVQTPTVWENRLNSVILSQKHSYVVMWLLITITTRCVGSCCPVTRKCPTLVSRTADYFMIFQM